MKHRIIPDAHPDRSPKPLVSAFKANLIRGGLMLDMLSITVPAMPWAGLDLSTNWPRTAMQL